MITVFLVLVVAAFICAILSALAKCPCWVADILICVALLLQALPSGK